MKADRMTIQVTPLEQTRVHISVGNISSPLCPRLVFPIPEKNCCTYLLNRLENKEMRRHIVQGNFGLH